MFTTESRFLTPTTIQPSRHSVIKAHRSHTAQIQSYSIDSFNNPVTNKLTFANLYAVVGVLWEWELIDKFTIVD